MAERTTIDFLVSAQVTVEVDWVEGLDPETDKPSEAMRRQAAKQVWAMLEKAGIESAEVNAV